MRKTLAIAVILGAALAMGACGGSSAQPGLDATQREHSGSAASSERSDPAVTAREFIDALAEEDAEAFCRLTLPSIQRPNFAAADLPPNGRCEERAEEMFDYRKPDGAKPFWVLLKQAKVGVINLHCGERCLTATIMLENLPVDGGGTTSAPLPVALKGGQWLVGTP